LIEQAIVHSWKFFSVGVNSSRTCEIFFRILNVSP
jgi:predicted secreted protein